MPADNLTTANDLNLIPTLLIGCGGTGKETLLRIRKMFYEKGMGTGNKSALVDYLVLDTDGSQLDKLNDSTMTPHMRNILSFNKEGATPEAIDISITPAQAQNYLQGSKRTYPNIFSWLNPDQLTNVGAMIKQGAGQNRQIGRLCFFHYYPTIRKAIEEKLTDLVGRASNSSQWLSKGSKVEQNSINVILVTSIAGGTGAGIFLDVSMLVKDILDKKFDRYNNNLTIYAVLPEAYFKVNKDEKLQNKIRENAFATLSEMEYFATDTRNQKFDLSFPPPVDQSNDHDDRSVYQVEWERGTKIPIRARFWHNCYIVGGTNDNQAATLTPDQTSDMLAEAIFLNFDESDFGGKLRSDFVNRAQLTLGHDEDPVFNNNGGVLYKRAFTRAFSVFGLSQIYFDRAKMRRAAAYRLAYNLVNDYWLRRTTSLPVALANKSLRDTGEQTPNNSEITNTGISFDPVISIGYEALEKNILMENQDQKITWIDHLKTEARELRQKIELESFDPLSDMPIKEFVAKHQVFLESNKRITDSGKVVREASQRRIRIENDVKNRLNALVLHRVKENGILETEEIIREYKAFVGRLESTARETLEYHVPDLGPWETRIHDARMIPLKRYAKVASKKEMTKAVVAAYESMRWSYLKCAASEIVKIVNLIKKNLNESNNSESYPVCIQRFREMIENKGTGVINFLENRYAELTKKGNAYGTNARTISLLGNMRDNDFDTDLKKLFTKDNEETWDWENIENLVVEKIKNSGAEWARNINDFGELVFAICPLEDIQPPSKEKTKEIAEEIAAACELVLLDKGYASKVNALNQFFQEKADDQNNCIETFKKYATPFMTINNKAISAVEKSRKISDATYLGLSNPQSPDAKRFLDQLQINKNPYKMRDDSIVLYIDKVGVPICLYDKLDALGAEYDKSNRKKDCHIDYQFLRYKLPEIRLVDQSSHGKNEEALEIVLQGIIMDVIPFDKETNQFRFRSGSHQLPFPIGGNLEEVVNYFVDSASYLEDLKLQVESEYKKWAAKEKGHMIAILRFSIVALINELKIRLIKLVNQGRITGNNLNVNPIFTNLNNRILPNVMQRLKDCGGIEWLGELVEYENLQDQRDVDDIRKVEAMNQWKTQTEGCWKIVTSNEMWFPVVNHQGRLKTK